MKYESVLESLSKKIKRNAEIIGDDLREFTACGDGLYFKDREKPLKLYHIFNWTRLCVKCCVSNI